MIDWYLITGLFVVVLSVMCFDLYRKNKRDWGENYE